MANANAGSNVIYECMRCGTPVTVEELSRLPEIKCICGFRVFRKARPPIVKQLKAI
mgnify:FL=1|jgi:DNA-directed RNA polymerase subunit P